MSEDKDLLTLEIYETVKIVDVPTFFKILQSEEN
jgi:hypothetical protein